ncbi:MAG TPA: DUF4058 family protein [Leptolyngbyaceae cyanobacterium]
MPSPFPGMNPYLEVREVATKEVVTVIEVLSPTLTYLTTSFVGAAGG